MGDTTFAKGRDANVYAGRDGQVYRKGEGGDWQKYNGRDQGGWSDVPGDRGRDAPRASNDLPGGSRGETRGSLDRQAQARDMGNARAAQNRSMGGGYGGGGGFGGARAGGGGRGGRR